MKMTRKKIIWAAVIVAVVGGVGFLATRKPTIKYETEKVVRGSVVEEVSVTGSLAPTHKIDLQPEVTGKITKLNVESGAVVKEGDVLAELDARDVQSKIVSQRAAVDAARARLAELSAGATSQELAVAQAAVDTSQSRLDSAVAAKADAQTALDNAKAKSDSQTSGKLQAILLDYDKAVVDAKDSVARLTGPMFTSDNLLTFSTTSFVAESNVRNSRALAKDNADQLAVTVAAVKSAGTVSAALNAYSSIAAGLNAVKAHLGDCREVLNYTSGLSSATIADYRASVSNGLTTISGTIQLLDNERSSLDLQARQSDSDISNAKSALTSATYAIDPATKSLAQAQADLTLKKTGNRAEVIASQRAQVEVQDAALSGYLTELSKRRITAPIDGIVTNVPVEIGETVSPGKSAISMQTKGNFEITTNVSEIDIGRVKVGDPVGITLDAFPKSEKWTGKVIKIDPAEKVVEGVIFYETTIVFDNEDPRLRSGMTANLIVETNRKEDALRVPLRALHDSGTKTTVNVLRNGASMTVDVTVGLQNNTHAELLTGLQEGDEVIVGQTAK
jgi:RND family efflux transporter MFP subunit